MSSPPKAPTRMATTHLVKAPHTSTLLRLPPPVPGHLMGILPARTTPHLHLHNIHRIQGDHRIHHLGTAIRNPRRMGVATSSLRPTRDIRSPRRTPAIQVARCPIRATHSLRLIQDIPMAQCPIPMTLITGRHKQDPPRPVCPERQRSVPKCSSRCPIRRVSQSQSNRSASLPRP